MDNRDGGPVHPVTDQYNERGELCHKPNTGMTMRQYYKAAALNVIWREHPLPESNGFIAEMVGKLADAMLAEDEAHEREGK